MRGVGDLDGLGGGGWMTLGFDKPCGGGRIVVTYGDLKRSAENREHWREMVKREKIAPA